MALLLSEPLVPVTVTTVVPIVAAAVAERVSVLVPLVLAGLKLAVTPLGKPLAASATLPVKPPLGVTVMVAVPLAPSTIPRLAGLDARLKLGATLPGISRIVVSE